MRKLLPLVVFVAACGHVPTPEELAEQTSTDLQSFWNEAVATARITNTMQVRDELFSNIEGLQFMASSSSRPTIPDSSTTTDAFTDLHTLTTRIFRQANVLEQGSSSITFRVNGTDFCTPLRGGVISATCVVNTDKLKVAVRAAAGSSGTTVTLLLNDTIEIATATIQKGVSVGVMVDLANAQAASEFVNTTLGTDSPFRKLTFVGSGQVEAKVTKWAANDFEATVSFLTDLSGTVTDDNGFSRSGKSPARTPAVSVRVNGPDTSVAAKIDIGATEYRGLWSDFFDYNIKTALTWDLAGLTLSAVAKDGGDRKITGISLGDGNSTLKFGEQTVVTAGLNPNSGRSFDIEVSTGNGGLDAFTAKPGVSANIAFDLQQVVNAGSSIDPNLVSATLQYDFSSGDQAPRIELLRATSALDGAWDLVNGRLSLASASPAATRTFDAVTCMHFRQTSLMQGMNPFVEVFESKPCP